MREYKVKVLDKINWETLEKAPIDNFWWLSGYEPECFAQVAVLKNRGLCVRLTAYEANPLAKKTEFNTQVCEDSCLEFFASFDSTEKYINVEMNSIGTCLAHMHFADGTAESLDKLIPLPEIKARREQDFWTVEFMLSLSDIAVLFDGVTLDSGYSFRANFYKCGDCTEKPHYGMWNKVIYEKPSFHQPDQFGKLIIE